MRVSVRSEGRRQEEVAGIAENRFTNAEGQFPAP
jgi:hypothetical protein